LTPYLHSVMDGEPLRMQYPHCDWRILHSPGVCQYCDAHAAWQQERIAAKVLFTDDVKNTELIEHYLQTGAYPSDERPCPAQQARGSNCQVWGGNVPRPPEAQ
jgi:hypothetical protein